MDNILDVISMNGYSQSYGYNAVLRIKVCARVLALAAAAVLVVGAAAMWVVYTSGGAGYVELATPEVAV